jgi:hypothetical protein
MALIIRIKELQYHVVNDPPLCAPASGRDAADGSIPQGGRQTRRRQPSQNLNTKAITPHHLAILGISTLCRVQIAERGSSMTH